MLKIDWLKLDKLETSYPGITEEIQVPAGSNPVENVDHPPMRVSHLPQQLFWQSWLSSRPLAVSYFVPSS